MSKCYFKCGRDGINIESRHPDHPRRIVVCAWHALIMEEYNTKYGGKSVRRRELSGLSTEGSKILKQKAKTDPNSLLDYEKKIRGLPGNVEYNRERTPGGWRILGGGDRGTKTKNKEGVE